MSVITTIIGAKQESTEYQCAKKLKLLFERELPNSVLGEIIIHANATMVGQTVKDIDILVLGTLHNWKPTVSYTDINQNPARGPVDILSFCTAIEVKSHDISGVFREGTEFYVRYGRDVHSATTQSNEQKISVRRFLERSIGYGPFVTNIIWFAGITREELKGLLTTGGNTMPSNAISSDFTLAEFAQALVWQKTPSYYRGRGEYHFDCSDGSAPMTDYSRAFHTFAIAKEGMGSLTRKRIEQITSKAVKASFEKPTDGKLSIYRGRAGTGKTVGLIQLAISLVDEEDARVLILTYNRALVSDIQRLFTLAELPDLFSDSCVSIESMQAFFYRIINCALYDGNLTGEVFLDDYDGKLAELIRFLDSGEDAVDFLTELMHDDRYLEWDYCMIDEAQDWTESEQQIIVRIFGCERLIVADGGQQFVRNVPICDWTTIADRKSVRLKQNLRQKSNLVKFINNYLTAIDREETRISDSGKLPGGKVLVCMDKSQEFPLFKQELEALKRAGNIPYDMLFLVPSSCVAKQPRHFLYKKCYEEQGIFLWDGTNEETRRSFSPLGDEVRVLQYDSARGLEAWTVVCIAFDEFIEEKKASFKYQGQRNSLHLESELDVFLKHIINWMMIPLTRAIDTIVITLVNPHSETSKQIRKLAENDPDFITLIEEGN